MGKPGDTQDCPRCGTVDGAIRHRVEEYDEPFKKQILKREYWKCKNPECDFEYDGSYWMMGDPTKTL